MQDSKNNITSHQSDTNDHDSSIRTVSSAKIAASPYDDQYTSHPQTENLEDWLFVDTSSSTHASPNKTDSVSIKSDPFKDNSSESTKPPTQLPKKSKKSPNVVGLFVVLLLVLGSSVGIYLVNQNQEIRQQASEQSGNAVIATVGEENIYQKDLDIELQYFPPIDEVNGQSTKEYLLEKMINDSRVLQEFGAKDANLYNNPNKDYIARTKRAHELMMTKELEIMNQSAATTGIIITMWYQNQTLVNGYTIEETQPLVKSKIDRIHSQVTAGTLTTTAASEQIIADEEQERIDPSADGNAFVGFQLRDSDQVLFNNQEFTTELRSLPVGGVTKVYDLSPSPTEKMYAFGVVKVKNDNRSPISTLDQWLASLAQKYPANVN